MSLSKYHSLLGTFVAIAVVLALIMVALFTIPDRREADRIPGWIMGSSAGLTFQYPPSLGKEYISILDWPPQFQVEREDFECVEAGESEEQAGRTEMRDMNGREYCVTEVVGGAAGSVYTQHAYAFEHEPGTVIMTFTTQMPHCENYPEAERGACETERFDFELDELVAKIAETVE